MTRPPAQRLKDAQERRWYAPIPLEQIHECGAKLNTNAVGLALEDLLGKVKKEEGKLS